MQAHDSEQRQGRAALLFGDVGAEHALAVYALALAQRVRGARVRILLRSCCSSGGEKIFFVGCKRVED